MRFFRAGVTSNEAPAAERAEPPVHFYQAYYTHYIHTSGATCPLVHVQKEVTSDHMFGRRPELTFLHIFHLPV